MAATASTMLMLLRPCGAVHRHVRLLGQGKAAFLTTSARRNVFSSPRAKLVQEEQQQQQQGDGPGPRMVKGFRCESTIAGQPEESSLTKSMANKIKDQLSAETVIVNDVSGDGQHVSIYAVSSAFEGQSAVNRQRMVYKAIWEELQSTVHAVDHMVTRTPAEAGLDQQSS